MRSSNWRCGAAGRSSVSRPSVCARGSDEVAHQGVAAEVSALAPWDESQLLAAVTAAMQVAPPAQRRR